MHTFAMGTTVWTSPRCLVFGAPPLPPDDDTSHVAPYLLRWTLNICQVVEPFYSGSRSIFCRATRFAWWGGSNQPLRPAIFRCFRAILCLRNVPAVTGIIVSGRSTRGKGNKLDLLFAE